MASNDASRWDERHAAVGRAEPLPPAALQPPPGDPLAAAVLAALVPSLAAAKPGTGRALDVACGRGGQAVWAARSGLQVIALDVSPVAVAATSELAAEHGVADAVEARVHDLDLGLPEDVLPGEFDLVLCQRFRDPRLYDSLLDRLAADGVAAITVLSAVGASEPGPFHAPPGELADLVAARPDVEVIRSVEGHGEASIVVRRRR